MLRVPESDRLALVIGIAGHRDIAGPQLAAVGVAIRESFRTLHGRFPNTPLVLLSPLAEGADRLAARVGLESGVRLIVPLPLPRALYESDFTSAESRVEFDKLLARAESHFELPLAAGNTLEDISRPGIHRDLQYDSLGAYIAAQTQILIAVWDGVENHRPGSTATTVRYRLAPSLDRDIYGRSALDASEEGPVYHIWSDQDSSEGAPEATISFRKLFPAGYGEENLAETAFDRIVSRIDTYNEDLSVLGDREIAASPAGISDASAERAARHLGRADALAMYFQRRSNRALLISYSWISMAGVLFILTMKFGSDKPFFLFAYLGIFFVGWLWYLQMKRKDYENKYLDYRALAEGLRVQLFWRIAGISESVDRHYLRNQRSELSWIRMALRVWNLLDRVKGPRQVPNYEPTSARLGLVLQDWLKAQQSYYNAAVPAAQLWISRVQQAVKLSFWIAIVLVVMRLATIAPSLALAPIKSMWQSFAGAWNGASLMALGIITLFAGLLNSYLDKRGLPQHARQYGRMQRLFQAAVLQMEELLRSGRYAAAQALAFEVGQDSLAENADWVMLHRERAIDPYIPQ